MFLAKGQAMLRSYNSIMLIILCSSVMALGTSIEVPYYKGSGNGYGEVGKYQGFSADLAGGICLFIASIFGLPVSTTHKDHSYYGCGCGEENIIGKLGVVKEMVSAWILTFPGCGLLGFIMALLFMRIF